jgi:hypothetical protein
MLPLPLQNIPQLSLNMKPGYVCHCCSNDHSHAIKRLANTVNEITDNITYNNGNSYSFFIFLNAHYIKLLASQNLRYVNMLWKNSPVH